MSSTPVQAVAATPAPALCVPPPAHGLSGIPTALADAAGERGNPSREAWHIDSPITDYRNRLTIRDENGLLVAECAAEDAPLIVEAPAMEALLRQLARHASGNPGQPMPDVAVGEIVLILGRIGAAPCASCHSKVCGGECLG